MPKINYLRFYRICIVSRFPKSRDFLIQSAGSRMRWTRRTPATNLARPGAASALLAALVRPDVATPTGHALGRQRPVPPLEGRARRAEVVLRPQHFPVSPPAVLRDGQPDFLRATPGSSISTVAWRIACGASEGGAEQARRKL